MKARKARHAVLAAGSLCAALALSMTAGPVWAVGSEEVTPPPKTGEKSRADVKAETHRAGKAGELNRNIECAKPPTVSGGKTRAQVRKETEEAGRAGELNKNIECPPPNVPARK